MSLFFHGRLSKVHTHLNLFLRLSQLWQNNEKLSAKCDDKEVP